jgi:hypothetical protein
MGSDRHWWYQQNLGGEKIQVQLGARQLQVVVEERPHHPRHTGRGTITGAAKGMEVGYSKGQLLPSFLIDT